MIDKLTKSQEANLAEYRDKWLKIGLSTDRVTFGIAKPIIDGLYTKILNKKSVPVIILRSPLEAWLGTLYVANLFYKGSQVASQVESQAWSQVWSQVASQVGSYLWPYLSGNYWAAYFSYYTFVNKSLGLKFKNQSLWDILTDTSKLSLIYPLNQVCVLSDKPVSIHMKEGLLHRDGGKSVEYSDGFGVYSLNGVRVPEYLAMTPEGSLSLDFFKKEKNADVKAEFIRKYGIERMIGLGKKLDKVKATDNDWWVKSEYELIDMAPIFTGIGKAPHLLMKNQTTGTYHLEGVDPSCKTIEEALKFRQNNRIASIMEVR